MNADPTPRRTRALWSCLAGVVLLAGGLGFLSLRGCSRNGAGMLNSEPPPVTSSTAPHDIAQRSKVFCGNCHTDPPADTFPRSAWKDEIERMYMIFGQSGRPLQPPPIEPVVKYYEDRAPLELPPSYIRHADHPLPIRFLRTDYPAYSGPSVVAPPHISNVNLVHLLDPTRLDVLACEMMSGMVLLLQPYLPQPKWRVLYAPKTDKEKGFNPAHTEVVDLDKDSIPDILVANLGSFPPTDRRCGTVVWLRGRRDGSFEPITLLSGRGRIADVQAADINGDGKLDLIVACFGWNSIGEILYLENQTSDWQKPRFTPYVLDERHGAIHVPITDLNGDGRPDFIALISQESEAIVAFLNEGGGRFRKQTLYQGPHPGYGSSGIQLADLNGDGKLDILYTNGDVLDRPYLLKPYHSVQWLENRTGQTPVLLAAQAVTALTTPNIASTTTLLLTAERFQDAFAPEKRGELTFVHHPLTPMYGVHRAVAADLDGDGDLDIIASSFLPADNFKERQEQKLAALVVLEQTAPGVFAYHVLETGNCNYVSCAAGDVFGTGRQDIVTGAFTGEAIDYAITIWKNQGTIGGLSGPKSKPQNGQRK